MSLVDEARKEGYTEDEIQAYLAPRVEQARAEGYSEQDIGKYLGVKPVDGKAAQRNLAGRVYDGLTTAVGNKAKQVAGTYEAAASMGSSLLAGFPAYLVGGIAGLAVRNTYDPDLDPKEMATKFAQAVTYDPRSDSGKAQADTLAYPFHLLTQFKERMGKAVADKTGSATLAAITDETIGMLPAVVVSGLARSFKAREVTPSEVYTAASEIVPEAPFPQKTIIAKKVQEVYEQTGIDPQTLKAAAAADPAVMADLASSNRLPFKESAKPSEPAMQPAPNRRVQVEPTSKAAPKSAEPGTPQAAQEAIMARIALEAPERPRQTLSETYTALKDDIYPIAEVEKALAKGIPLETAESPYRLARLTRGSAGKASQFLDHGAFDFNTYKTIGPGLNKILAPFGKDLNGLRAYLVARRAQELRGRGIETGVPAAEAAMVVAGGKQYAAAAESLYAYQNSLAKYMKDAGLLGDDAYAAMLELNKDYVPMHRLFEGESGGSAGTGAGLSVRNPIRAIKGSERIVLDPLESIIKNTYVYTALAEKNAVGRAFGELVTRDPATAEALGVTVSKQKMRAIEITDAEIARALTKQGADAEVQTFSVFRPNALQPGPNQIRYYDNGKPRTLEVPKEVAEAFNAVDRQSAGMLLNILAMPARTLRAGAVLAPDFMLRNVFRDQLSAFTFSKNGYIPVWDMLRGAMSAAKKDVDFQNWLKSGGPNSAMVALDRNYLQQHLMELNKDTGLMRKSWNVVSSPLEVLRITSELMENATRLGEFKRATKGATDKATIQEAGFQSREVTLDFARIGAQTRGLNMIAAFFNAGVEGLDRTARAFKDRPMATTAKVAASVTMPSILLWYANNNTPERQARWREIPNWQRDLFWIVMTEDNIYRIPKPFELGVIFGSSAERMLDQFAADKPDAMKGFLQSVGEMATANVMPTGAVPLLEQMTNHSMFTGNPLIPRRMEGILPEYQYTEYTTELAKAVGRMVGAFPGLKDKSIASPMVIDNYIRGWTGTLGVYIEKALDAGLREAGVLPDVPKPLATLADIPVVKAFIVRYPAATAQSVQDFYEKHNQRQKVYATFQHLVKQGDADAALREAELDPAAFARLDGIQESLALLNTNIRMVHRNPDMTPTDKRQLIDSMYGQMIELTRAGNKAMAEVDAALKVTK